MPRLNPVHWKTLECIFLNAGFKFERETGDHRVYSKDGIKRPIIIPKYKEVGRDIIMNNMRSAGMTRKEYFDLLSQC